MKYLVMECHEAYAILMDEESRFYHAANLHYSVGQTVTEPILMQTQIRHDAEKKASAPRIRRIVMRVSAAAACLLLAAGAGTACYIRQYHTDSVVILNSDANIQMYLNKKGSVVKLVSENDAGDALLDGYDGLHKNKVTVAHELLALQKANGSINDGDTVELYISAQSADAFDAYKSEFESDISTLKLNVSVQDLTEHPEITAPAAPDTPEDKNTGKAGKPEKEKAEPPVRPDPKSDPTPPAKPEDQNKPAGRIQPESNPAHVQPPAPAIGNVPSAEPPVDPVKPPTPPESDPHSDKKPDEPADIEKPEDDPKPEKNDPQPLKPEKPNESGKELPSDIITPPDGQGKKMPEKPAPHLQEPIEKDAPKPPQPSFDLNENAAESAEPHLPEPDAVQS